MMNFKKFLIVSTGLLVSFTTQANVVLDGNKQILGEWSVYAEAAALNKEKTALTVLWDFKENGTLHTEAEDRRGRTKRLSINLKYKVEDGVLKKQLMPGRSKMESCQVIKLEGNDMTLKCKFLHLFLRR